MPLERNSLRGKDLAAFTHVSEVATSFCYNIFPETEHLPVAALIDDGVVYTRHAFTPLDMAQRDQCDSWIFKRWAHLNRHAFYVQGSGRPTFFDFLRTLILDDATKELGIAQLADSEVGLFSQLARIPSSPDHRTKKTLFDRLSHRYIKYWPVLQMLSFAVGLLGYPSLFLPFYIPSIDPGRAKFMKPETKEYLDLVAKWSTGRVFFVTKQGRIRLGVAATKPGDAVAMLSYQGHVACTPFAIRHVNQTYYQLKG